MNLRVHTYCSHKRRKKWDGKINQRLATVGSYTTLRTGGTQMVSTGSRVTRWKMEPWQGPQRKDWLAGVGATEVTQKLLSQQRKWEGAGLLPSGPLQPFASTSHWLNSSRSLRTRSLGNVVSSHTKQSWEWQGLDWADREDCCYSNWTFSEQAQGPELYD